MLVCRGGGGGISETSRLYIESSIFIRHLGSSTLKPIQNEFKLTNQKSQLRSFRNTCSHFQWSNVLELQPGSKRIRTMCLRDGHLR